MKTIQNIFIGVLLSSFFISCQAQTEKTVDPIQVMSAEEFNTKLKENQNPQLIDVRSLAEYKSGNIENSLNWDYTNGDFERNIQELDKESEVFLYCASGNRSGKASEILKNYGFTKIYDLRGGYAAWKANNL